MTFGKINSERLTIAPNINKFVSITTKNGNNFINPITKIFLDKLLSDFNKASSIGRIVKQNTNLYPISVLDAGTNPYVNYDNYINTLFDSFIQQYKTTNDIEKLISFGDINLEFIKFLIRLQIPNTFSSYILSRYNSIQSSGLSVKLFDQSTINKDITKDPNYNFYVNTVTNNGFLIDQFNKGTIVLNLGHEGVIRELNRQGITKVSDFYSAYYITTDTIDISFFSSLVTKKYNNFCGMHPYAHPRKYCINTSFTQDIVARNLIDFKNLYSKYDLLYWLKIYLYVRALETHKNWSQVDFDFYVNNLTSIYNANLDNSYDSGLQYVKKIIGRYPFPQSTQPTKFYYEPRV